MVLAHPDLLRSAVPRRERLESAHPLRLTRVGVKLAGAHVVGERLRLAVRELHYENAGSPLGIVTISVGVSCAILEGETVPERLVEQAERALYDAKCAGRDRTHVLIG